jgi:hypothetical protein
LGSSRYRGRCGHAITNAYGDTNSKRNSDANSYSYGYPYGDAQCYANRHSNGYG